MPIKSLLPDLQLSRETLAKSTIDAMERFGDLTAIVDPLTDEKFTFRQLREESIQVALKLRSIGVRKGTVVGLILDFNRKNLSLFMGIALCKATTAFFYVNSDKATLSKQLAQVEVSICIVKDSLRDKALRIQKIMNVEEINAVKIVDDDTRALFDTSDVNVMEDPLFLFFTSGSTGVSKIVEVTNFGMLLNARGWYSTMQQLPGDVCMTVCKQMHGSGILSTFMYALGGVQHVIAESISANTFDLFVSKYKVNSIVMSSISALKDIVEHGRAGHRDHLKFIMTAGVKFPPDLTKEARKKLGVHVSSGWGSTEAGSITIGRSLLTPPNSAGLLFPNVELKTVDVKSGKELSAGENGELCVRSPLVMKGYYKAPLETAKVFDAEGWLHTGDFGYYDDNGFVYIIDRLKNMIKTRDGISVFPTELEEVLLSHPGVLEAVVVKVDHSTFIEAPRAFVVRSDQDLTESDLLSFYNSRVAEFKQLFGGLEFVDEIPKTGFGKPLKHVLAMRGRHIKTT